MVGQVGGQDDVPHQVQHALIVLSGGGEMSHPPVRHPFPLPGSEEPLPISPSPVLSHLPASIPSPRPWPYHLSGEVVEDVATVGVEDGDGLSEVVPLGEKE